MNVIKIKSRIRTCVSVAYILNAFRVLSTSNVRVVLIAIDKNVLKTIFFNSSSCILLRLKCAFPSRHPNNTKSCQILEWKYDFFTHIFHVWRVFSSRSCYFFVPLEETVEANSSNLKALTIYLQYLFTPPVDILRTTYLYLSHGVIKIDSLEGTRPVQNLSTTGFDY